MHIYFAWDQTMIHGLAKWNAQKYCYKNLILRNMTMPDRRDATYAELKAKLAEMEKQFRTELTEMAKRVEQARKSEQAGALEQIKAIMQNYGLSSTDLGAGGKLKKVKAASSSVPVKYRGPNGETWTGRGRAPKWIVDIKDREQFKV